ncbi:MAG TPA: MFS transporter [Roseateles sp.]|uniref:MFS transporter n=1 Tax=Roseateles sp. TaxID=1971397 RepID=UPI002ED9964B
MTVAQTQMEPGAAAPDRSDKYTPGSAFRRYKIAMPLAVLAVVAALGGVSSIIFPLQIQKLEFAQFFVGADAGIDLKQLSDLKAAVAAGTTVPTADQSRLIGILNEYEAARAKALSLGMTIVFALTMLVQPIVGALSDRTRSGWGRRAPWIAAGGVLGAAMIVLLRYSETVGMLIAMFAMVQIAISLAQGPLNTTVADRVPQEKLAVISTLNGLGLMLGALVGALVTGQLYARMGVDAALPLAVTLVVMTFAFIFIAPDRSSVNHHAPKVSPWAMFPSLFVSLKDRDFALVWTARAIFMLGWQLTGTFSVYMLQSYIQPTLTAAEAAKMGPLMGAVSLPATLIAMGIAGKLSDKWKKRKVFVIIGSFGMASSFLVPAFWPALPALFIQHAIAGISMGLYYAIDTALMIEVLPDKDGAAGRDLGMTNVSTTLGMTLGPIVAGQVVALTGSYQLVWIVGSVLVALAAVLILPVRRAN